MCELNLVKTVCYSKVINYLFIIIIKKYAKAIIFLNNCCSTISRGAVKCDLNVVKVKCVTVKLTI